MAFDVYSLMKSEEVREYLRKNRKFTPLEQEAIIRHSYYPIEEKLKFLKMLLDDTNREKSGLWDETRKEEQRLLEERGRLFEFIVNFIHNPGEDVIYMALQDCNGYDICRSDNDYRLSESLILDTHYFRTFGDLMKYYDVDGMRCDSKYKVCVDMVLTSEIGAKYNADEFVQPVWFHLMNIDGKMKVIDFGIDDKWFMRQGFSEGCLDDYFGDRFRSPLPFEHGCRVKLQTPAMRKPVYGIMDSSQDYYGFWYHFLWLEDAKHNTKEVRRLLKECESMWKEVDSVDIAYPLLEMLDKYMTYDWIERAEEQNE